MSKATLCELCFHGDVCGDRDCLDYDDEKALVFCNYFKSREEYVKVVRCKDCKHWMYECDGAGLCVTDVPDIEGVGRYADDFCRYGERKADD